MDASKGSTLFSVLDWSIFFFFLKKKYDVEKLNQNADFLQGEINDLGIAISDMHRVINNQTSTKKKLVSAIESGGVNVNRLWFSTLPWLIFGHALNFVLEIWTLLFARNGSSDDQRSIDCRPFLLVAEGANGSWRNKTRTKSTGNWHENRFERSMLLCRFSSRFNKMTSLEVSNCLLSPREEDEYKAQIKKAEDDQQAAVTQRKVRRWSSLVQENEFDVLETSRESRKRSAEISWDQTITRREFRAIAYHRRE